MTDYVALLRGINLGKRRIKMDDLREGFVAWGFEHVETLQAAGNVIFTGEQRALAELAADLEVNLQERYGYDVPVILRTLEEIHALVAADPFAGIELTPDTRLYATFLDEAPADVQLPFETPQKDYKILDIADRTVFSVLTLNPSMRTTDSMAILEQTFGKRITTRNWNTVKKIAQTKR